MQNTETDIILSEVERDIEERSLKREETAFKQNPEIFFSLSDDWKQGPDVEKIMQEIRADIRAAGYSERDMFRARRLADRDKTLEEAEGYNPKVLDEMIQRMRNTWSNPVYFPFQGNPVKAFLQKILQKIVGSSFYYAFMHQNRYNSALIASIIQLHNHCEELESELRILRGEVEQLKREDTKCD
ncbi:MAG: hypothetical protein K6E81_03340 [Lachnospiraceae bacterium]|nr:hypothetical protein [Lachnospiraceae bacterium]